jgi:hypothetical protein
MRMPPNHMLGVPVEIFNRGNDRFSSMTPASVT